MSMKSNINFSSSVKALMVAGLFPIAATTALGVATPVSA